MKRQLMGGLLFAGLVLLLVVMLAGVGSAQAQPAPSGSSYVILQADAITNTNGTAVAPVAIEYAHDELTVQVSGVVSGTVNWEATVDGSNWKTLLATNVSSGAAAVTTTAAGIFRMDVAGLRQVRARVSGIITNTTDTIDVAGYLTGP